MSDIVRENVLIALEMMWKGMLGIMVVMLIIAMLVYLFTRIDKWLVERKNKKMNA